MQRLVLVAAYFGALFGLSGCANLANWNSIHRDVDLTKNGSQLIDAKQRVVMVWPGGSVTKTTTNQNTTSRTEGHLRDKPGTKVETSTVTETTTDRRMIACAEPSPDVFSVLAASGELNVSNPSGVSVSGSAASNESGASLLRRTTTLQALRDAYFRLCEAHANGAIDAIDLMVGQRHNQTSLIGLLAIEQLTGAIAAPSVALGGSSQAVSASAIQAVATSRAAEQKKNARLRKDIADAQKDKKPLAERIAAINTTLGKTDDSKPSADEAAKLRAEQADLQPKVDALDAKIAALTIEADNSDKAVEALTKALDTATQTGAMASSAPAVFVQQPDPQAQKQVAEAVVEIVKLINADDFGPTICLKYAREHVAETTGAKTTCDTLLQKYADAIDGGTIHVKSEAALNNAKAELISKLTPEQIASIDGAKLLDLAGADRNRGSGGVRFFTTTLDDGGLSPEWREAIEKWQAEANDQAKKSTRPTKKPKESKKK